MIRGGKPAFIFLGIACQRVQKLFLRWRPRTSNIKFWKRSSNWRKAVSLHPRSKLICSESSEGIALMISLLPPVVDIILVDWKTHQLFHPYLHLHLCFVGQLADIQVSVLQAHWSYQLTYFVTSPVTAWTDSVVPAIPHIWTPMAPCMQNWMWHYSSTGWQREEVAWDGVA